MSPILHDSGILFSSSVGAARAENRGWMPEVRSQNSVESREVGKIDCPVAWK